MTDLIQLRLDGSEAWPVIVEGVCERCATPFDIEDRAPCPRCIDAVVKAWTTTGGSWTTATARAYRVAAEAWYGWAVVDGVDPEHPTGEDLARWLGWSAAVGLGYATIRQRYYGVLSTLRARAEIRGDGFEGIDGRPARAVLRQLSIRGGRAVGVQAIRRDEVRQAIRGLVDEDRVIGRRELAPYVIARDRVILVVGYAIGARPSDLASLKWDDLVRGSGVVTVRLRSPKTGYEADLPIWRSRDPAFDVVAAVDELAGFGTDGPVFASVTKRGGRSSDPLSAAGISERVGLALARVGIPGRSGHGLRSGFVTDAIEAGISGREIRAVTGHRDAASFDRYIAADDLQRNRALRLL